MRHAADRKISEYSRGMRQRIKIGQSLIHNPSIIFADEPLSGTDPIGRKLMIDLFHNLSKDDKMTIVVSSHVLHELERISEKNNIFRQWEISCRRKSQRCKICFTKCSSENKNYIR